MENFNLTSLENSFYKYARECNGFKRLTEKRKEVIKILSDFFQCNNFTDKPLENYVATIKFLNCTRARVSASGVNTDYEHYFNNFDEAMFFFIYTLDPELQIAQMFLDNNESNIRKKFGFYNINIVTMELDYLKSIDTELALNVKHDFPNRIRTLQTLCTLMKRFTSITQERYDEIKQKAIYWNNLPIENKLNNCLYNVFYQYKLLELNTDYEKLLFIVLALDPNFNLLQIFEDESNYERIKERSLNELGFYIPELIKTESTISNTFNTGVEIISWTK